MLTLIVAGMASAQPYRGGSIHDDHYVQPRRNLIINRHTNHAPAGAHSHNNLDAHVRGEYVFVNGEPTYLRTPDSVPVVIQFGSFSHVDDLASRMEFLSNELCLDMYYNYQHNRDFMATYREAYQILKVARFIHDAEHLNDRDAIRRQLGGLDALFHHVEDDMATWHRHNNRQIGHLGIQAKLSLLESTLHHLMNDVGVESPVFEIAPLQIGGIGVVAPPLAAALFIR